MGRLFSSLQLHGDFMWHPGGVRSAQNLLPDCASRWRVPERREKFWSTCRELGIDPVERTVTDQMFDQLMSCFR